MGLISPGEQNLLDFLELRQVLSTYDGDHRDPLWWSQERPVPMRVARGRRERREFFPDHAGTGSLLSSMGAETGLLWMWARLSSFLSIGDGYVGEHLELQQGCEGPFGSSRC